MNKTKIINKKENKETILKKYWGFDTFRGNQGDAIQDLIDGKDVVYIAKTGDGKSICYQIPAIISEGLTIVISPLKSLMKDQVKNLESVGVKATFINSDLNLEEKRERFYKLMKGYYDLIYVAPEKIVIDKFIEALKKIPGGISYFIIDEFDTVSEYGNTGFRPEYLKLGKIKEELEKSQTKKIPVGIFTATATEKVEKFVTNLMKVKEGYKLYKGTLLGENLRYQVDNCGKKDVKDMHLDVYLEMINKKLKQDKGSCIIFCSTTKEVEALYEKYSLKYNVGKYHGKMLTSDKNEFFNEFMDNKIQFIFCTNAFGRGVDKPDIRYILHYGIPGSISSYMQEIGRGGRDGEIYRAIIMITEDDIGMREFLINLNEEGRDESLKEFYKLLKFLKSKECKTHLLHTYFNIPSPTTCIQCENCIKNKNKKLKELSKKGFVDLEFQKEYAIFKQFKVGQKYKLDKYGNRIEREKKTQSNSNKNKKNNNNWKSKRKKKKKKQSIHISTRDFKYF